jgi:hypothetical protein
MQVYFQLKSKERYAWRLVDTEPMQELILRAEQNKDCVLETVMMTDVMAKIEQMSIKSAIDIDALRRELDHPTYQPVRIARGQEAVPGRDATLKMYFPEQIKSEFFDVSGHVDFRNHLQIPAVKPGDLIAKKIPMEKGVPGCDVFGKTIQPAEPKDIIIVAKPSVELTPDGEIRALRSGRPRITGNRVKTFDVSPVYTVPGDVDIETGNIVFAGDVMVHGNVMDHMMIESLGNVYVYGNVYSATVTATGSIFVRGNVLGGKLYSGNFGVRFNRLYQASKKLGEQIASLIAASRLLIRILESRKQKVQYGQIILLLIEGKFKDIPAMAKELLAILATIQHMRKDEHQELAEMCSVFCHPHQIGRIPDISFQRRFLSLLHTAHHEVARMRKEKSEVRLNQCYKSEIKSNGDIIIHRDGVILSSLYAARHILFMEDSTVCRGSALEAGGSIMASIVGGQTGVDTLLKAKVKISVRKMFTGRICVGKRWIDIDRVIEDKTFSIHELDISAI